ncbi:MAG: hypothetical protein GC168_09995 [Candidatus Hydrogenedens sp.]|nr:hypothetical protein [Candidatus Hydrogenedens sp.]
MKTILPTELERQKAEEELEVLVEFLLPGYSVVDDAMNRLQESDPKGYTLGKYFDDAYDCAAHLMPLHLMSRQHRP